MLLNNKIARFIGDLVTHGFEKFGRYYSKYRGFVVDREDPQGYSRLIVRVPNIHGTNLPKYWAWPAGTYAGKGYGVQVIPNVGDVVWVEFEFGDPKRPIWSYGYFGKDDKPRELKDYNNYWFKTPQGNIVELDDTTETIRFTSKGGKIIEILDKIHLGAKGGAQQPAVVGDDAKEVLDDIYSDIDQIITDLQSFATTQATASAGTLAPLAAGYTQLGSAMAALKTTVTTHKQKTQEILSTTVTIDKS